jgi:hypothetical protein
MYPVAKIKTPATNPKFGFVAGGFAAAQKYPIKLNWAE